ncbi:hypothetical protein ACUXNS_000033 [Brevibacterium pityocampae]
MSETNKPQPSEGIPSNHPAMAPAVAPGDEAPTVDELEARYRDN